jgi:hypothetical protein
MKVHQFISRLDEARFGRRVIENEVADAPSHAPKSSSGYTTPSSGKSEDKGERMGGERDAIKKSSSSIPTPVAKAPSHAPTSGKDATTSGKGSSEDQGEKVSKEAMKENLLNRILNAEYASDIQDILRRTSVSEGRHKPGCKCGFCANMRKFGKKSTGSAEEPVEENHLAPSIGSGGRPGAAARPFPAKRRLGGERMGFRHPSAATPRPKAAINPNQPAMERLDTSSNARRTISEMADALLEAPDYL